MFDNIKKVQKEKGRKFMEMSPATRNACYAEQQEDLEKLAELLGAKSVVLHIEDNASACTMYHQVDTDATINLFESLLKRIQKRIAPNVLKALATSVPNNDGGSLNGISPERLNEALQTCLEDMPEELQNEFMAKISKLINGEIKPTKPTTNDDEDDLLNDLLK